MPNYPLLLFPAPEVASRSKPPGRGGKFHKPPQDRQVERITPKLQQLQTALNERRIAVQGSTAGIDPEMALVIETVGTVEGFVSAVGKIDGLEWLGELEEYDIEPDEDFYDEKHPEKMLGGRLFFLFFNQTALTQLLNLWDRYNDNQGKKFSDIFDRGLASLGRLFKQIKNIRYWDVQDRLLQTGIIDSWRQDLERNGDRLIKFETELWFRGSLEKRQQNRTQVTGLIHQFGGRVLQESIIDDIAYHALLAELPASSIQNIIDSPSTALVKCDNIMFFRPTGQMSAGERSSEGEVENETLEGLTLPTGVPVVAILDGLPLANHQLLANRLIIDDPDNWRADYAANECIHGTTMASLVIHGDLNDSNIPLPRPIYVRPIMKPRPWIETPRPERMPEDILGVDLIHRAVKRLFEGDATVGPVAPHIKIINMSIGDPSRQFCQAMSPLARLLDWLSAKYNVLFIISAGNHLSPLALGIALEEFETLRPDQIEETVINALFQEAANRRLLSPSESINGITVGALHFDNSNVTNPGNRFDPFAQAFPSLTSAFGGGYRRAIKPDIVFMGGRQWYARPYLRTQPVTLDADTSIAAPGNRVAYPSSQAGNLTALAYTRGTSNASALISRAAGICYDSLIQIISDQAADINAAIYMTPLLKAMIVHGCTWGDLSVRIADVLRTGENGRQINGCTCRWLGYGMPRIDRVLDCNEQRISLLGFGQLSDGEAHVFCVPLPPSLGARPEWRRLTVTLTWLSPISANTQKYRTASLWFEVDGVKLAKDRKESSGGQDGWRAVRRGTVQHEVFEGDNAEPFIDGDVIKIKVNCREDAGNIEFPIAYGIVVSLEVSEGVDIAIYNEVSTRVRQAINIQPTRGENN